jgi:hypothetical protein
MLLQQCLDAADAVAQLRNTVKQHQPSHGKAQQQHTGMLLGDI